MAKNTILIDLSSSKRTDFGKVDFALQNREQQVFSAIWALESEVNHGGFAYYFASHSGDTATAAPGALREIGASRCADIVTRALKTAVPTGNLPIDQAEREALIESLSPAVEGALNALDTEFFSYPDNLTDLLYAYVEKHPAVFGPV